MRTPARPHSLRARLVATVLVLLAVTLSVIGVATTLALRQFLYGRLDREVVEANGRFVAAQTGQFPPPPGGFRNGVPDFLGPVQGPRTLGATIRGGVVQRAEVSSRGGGSSAVPDEDDAALLAVPVGEGPTSVDLSIGDYRMVATQAGDTIYVIGQPAGGAQDVIGRLVVVEVDHDRLRAAGRGFAGAVLVRRELRPLERVAATAAKVSALPLDRGEVELAERVPRRRPAHRGRPGRRSRSTRCWTTSGAPWRRARTARCGCGSSSPTPATSCARRSPRSAATPS